jgi:hypothetical protein
MSIGSSTVGPYLAARARLGVRGALGRVMRQPIIYAVAAGVIVNLGGFSLPGPVANASRLLAGGAVALMLLLLGLQLARLTARDEASGAALATVIRLVAVPPIAWGVGRLVGLEGMAFAVAVIQASTPDVDLFGPLGARVRRAPGAGLSCGGAIDRRQRRDADCAAGGADRQMTVTRSGRWTRRGRPPARARGPASG